MRAGCVQPGVASVAEPDGPCPSPLHVCEADPRALALPQSLSMCVYEADPRALALPQSLSMCV